jgi:hypothetical protein
MTKSNSPIAFLPAFIILSLTAAPRAGSSQEKGAAHELIAPFNSYLTVYDNHNVEPMRPDIFGTAAWWRRGTISPRWRASRF